MSTAVVVCGDSPHLPVSTPGAIAVEGLCRDPGLLQAQATDCDRAVVVLHEESFDLPALQKALRSVNIDPLGAQVLAVATDDDPSVLSYQIEGLRQRAEAYTRSEPENSKPVYAAAMTRRGFLRPPTPVHIAAPRVDHAVCAAGNGCRACVDVCPQGAYAWSAGVISYDKATCIPCGRCVTGCPTAAIENPAATPAMIDAQVRSVIAASELPLGIRFVCSRGKIDARPQWADISVPCTSMVPASWLLACRLLGATCAKAVPCQASGCPIDGDSLVVEASDMAQTILAQTGFEATMITNSSFGTDTPLLGENLFETRNAAQLMMAMASATETDIAVTNPSAELGIVSIDSAACTLCGQCAKICPTAALRESYDDGVISISFDATACVNCRQCTAECPEIERGAISVQGSIDTRRLSAGRTTLNEGTVVHCEICGNAIAPATMMTRISDLLGKEFEGTMKMLEKRCLDCRGRG